MAIELLTVCVWIGKSNRHEETLNPNWDQVKAAILALNNDDRNDLSLQPLESDTETYLAVGGGAGCYLVTGSINNERFPTVVNSMEDDGEKELLRFGGQTGYYPRHAIIDLDMTLWAVKSFFQTGEFEGGNVLWVDM